MRSLRKDSLLLDLIFLALVFAAFRMVSIRYGSRILRQEMEYRQNIINSLDDVVDSFILAETGKIGFLTPFLADAGSAKTDMGALLGQIKSVRAIYNVNREMRVDRILYLDHPNPHYLDNVNLTPRQIIPDMAYALQSQKTVITKLHSSVATGKYSFSFLFPHAEGILIAEADLENILEVVRATGVLETYKSSTVLLINPQNGQVHYSSDPAAYPYMQFSPATPEVATVGRDSYYYSMQHMKVLDLLLVVLTPRQALESFVGMMQRYLNLLLACLCLLTALRWYFIRQSVWKPLALFLKNIRQGESSGRHASRYQEWDRLGRAYDEARLRINAMTETLQSTRDFLRLIIDALPASVLVLDRRGRIVHWNLAARRVARVDTESPPAEHVMALFPFLAEIKDDFHAVLETQKPFSARGLPVQADAVTTYCDLVFSPLTSGSFAGGVLIILDVTRDLRKDLQLQQTQKMDMIGNLAGGLAHDLNNLLGGISGSAEMMGLLVHDPVLDVAEFDRYQALIGQSIARAAEMVRQLLTLSRKQEMDLRPADLNGILANVARLAERTLMKSVTLDLRPPEGDALVMADAARLEQVFLNLFINAAHAMTTMRSGDAEPGGAITVRLAQVNLGASLRAKHPDCAEGPHWLVAVSDSGVGMSPAVLQKIFEPFFTTRAKGTGLGLAMVYNIVQYHSGFIDVYSEEGRGSTFNVYLPALAASAHPPAPPPPAGPAVVRGQGLVLVADDDEVMRSTAADFLSVCGYGVLTAADGRECVETYQRRMAEIDAVLLDMVMPVLSGHDAYLQLLALNPNVKVLLCSGFKQDQRVVDILSLGAVGFVQKPYSLSDLSAAIHKAVAAAKQAKEKST